LDAAFLDRWFTVQVPWRYTVTIFLPSALRRLLVSVRTTRSSAVRQRLLPLILILREPCTGASGCEDGRMPESRSARTPRVHLLAGLNGSGKTTYARHLEATLPAVRFTLDEWMLRMHGLRYDDPAYPPLAESCKSLIWDTALQVLRAGVDVVLDWNQWSRERRREWAAKATAQGFESVVHYIRVPLDTAIAHATARNAQDPGYAHILDAAAIRHLASIFEEPGDDEDLQLQIIGD
jgi:predicted kinase